MSTRNGLAACAACGWTPGPLAVDPYPFRCAHAREDDADHLMRFAPRVRPSISGAAESLGQDWNAPSDPGASASGRTVNPFLRYRRSLYSWHTALAHDVSDLGYVSLVNDVDAAVERLCGRGFRETPFGRSAELSGRLAFEAGGGVWVKDETNNVSGSHKARHLMGVAVYLRVVERALAPSSLGRNDGCPLAVASCGNAALAAAVVARAIDRRLLVFVPEHASPRVLAHLEDLGARVTRCARPNSDVRTFGPDPRALGPPDPRTFVGDPCHLAFQRAIAAGALPFTCQGTENGLAIEGGATLGYEICDQLAREGVTVLDRVFIQVGGGALASACIQAFDDLVARGRLSALPRIHAVQTRGGYPLKRAYDLVADRLVTRLAHSGPATRREFDSDDDRARYLMCTAPESTLDEAFAYARSHRHEFMWPWETEPRSIAEGILDDETYDWAVVVEAMVRSGGFPIVVDEAALVEANEIGRGATGINADHTATAGLAGLLTLSRSAARPAPSERVAVLFTGVRR